MNESEVLSEIFEISQTFESYEFSSFSAKEIYELVVKYQSLLTNNDPRFLSVYSIFFHKSIFPNIATQTFPPSAILALFSIEKTLIQSEVQVERSSINMLLAYALRYNIDTPKELFEEIGETGLELFSLVLTDTISAENSAFFISIALDYAKKCPQSCGLRSMKFVSAVIPRIIGGVKPIFPGISSAATRICLSTQLNHKILVSAFKLLTSMWSTVALDDNDKTHIAEYLEKICEMRYHHPKARVQKAILAGTMVSIGKSACARVLFSAIADEFPRVKSVGEKFLKELGDSVLVSSEFEFAVQDLIRCAKRFDETKRLTLLQTIEGICLINKGHFDLQIQTSLQSLAEALILVSEIEVTDMKMVELVNGFLLRRRPYLGTPAHEQSFKAIISLLPADEFCEVLIDILNESPNKAPEIFTIFLHLANHGPKELMLSVVEMLQWWNPTTPRSVVACELAIEVSSLLISPELFQVLLYRIIECLSSPNSSTVSTALASLKRMSHDGDVSKLLLENVDYIADRFIARLQFIDVSPGILVVLDAILSVDGDISDLLQHISYRLFELIDTRPSFSLSILRLFPKYVAKNLESSEEVIRRSIHFILHRLTNHQCAALDAISVALPFIKKEEKLLPMIHQSWEPSILLLKQLADPASPSAWRIISLFIIMIKLSRSFVQHRIKEHTHLFTSLLSQMVDKIFAFSGNTQALKMASTIFDLIEIGTSQQSIFFGEEIEIFSVLASSFDHRLPQLFKDSASKCMNQLLKSSYCFVSVLMLEGSKRTPQGYQPTTFLPTYSKQIQDVIASHLPQ